MSASTTARLQTIPGRRRSHRSGPWTHAAAGLLGIALGAAGFWLIGESARPAEAPLIPAAPAAVPGKAFPGASITYGGNGIYQVPGQAPAGVYAVAAGNSSLGCAWHVKRADTDKPKDVIEEGALNRGESTQFTIGKEARIVVFDRDCSWARFR